MALPNAVIFVRGVKDTADNISQEKPLAIGNKIWMYDPNRNKGLAWLMRNGVTEPTFNHIFGHLEDSPFAQWVEYAGSDESSQATTGIAFTTGQGPRVTLGSRIYWPRIKEIHRLNAVMSTDSTGAVGRNFGRGNASTSLLKTSDKGLIISPAYEQGFTTGAGLANSKVYKTFATSEVSWPVQTTFVEEAEKARGGNPFVRALKKSWKASKDQMEGEAFLSGKKVDDSWALGAAHPMSVSEGLDNYISTHTYSASSLSRMDLWDILSEWPGRRRGGAIMCSGAFKAMVTMWALALVTMDQEAKADGMDVDMVKTPYGTFDLIDIDLFDQEPTLMGTAFFVPKGQHAYRPLIHESNLDIAYRPIERDEIHSKEGEIYGVYGWEWFEEEMFARVDGLQFAA